MKKANTLIAILASLLVTLQGNAQPYIDLFQGFYQYAPPTNNMKTFTHYRLQANLPVVMKKSGDIFLVNPIWESREVGNKFYPDQFIYTPKGLIIWFTYTKQLGHDRSLTLAAIPRWNGEPELQFSKGFQLGGAGLYGWRSGPKLQLKAGLYYNKEFFGNFFIPLFGGDWILGQKDRLFGVLPGSLTWEHRLGKTLSYGGNFRTFTNSYRISSRPSPNDNGEYIRIDDNQLGAYLDVYLAPKWVLTGEAGWSIHRQVRYGYHDTKADGAPPAYVPYLRIAFQYRLRLDKSKR